MVKGDEKYVKRKSVHKVILGFIVVFMAVNRGYAAEIKENNKGSIIIESEKQEGRQKFLCDKIADIEDGEYVMEQEYAQNNLNNINTSEELKKIIESINPCIKSKTIVQYADKEGKVRFENLQTGVYFVRTEGMNAPKMMPVLVSIPMWDELEKTMEYDVTVVPKYVQKETVKRNHPAKTSDGSRGNLMKMIGLCFLSFIAIYSIKLYRKILQKY